MVPMFVQHADEILQDFASAAARSEVLEVQALFHRYVPGIGVEEEYLTTTLLVVYVWQTYAGYYLSSCVRHSHRAIRRRWRSVCCSIRECATSR
jgi:hypothetical protein